ncbi:MAG: DUF255 domain-containing protein [Flavitalea sp.]
MKLLVLFLGIANFSFSQKAHNGPTKVAWITLEEAAEQLQKEKKPVLIDLYTDWCGWCKVMDKKTYNDKKVGDYLTSNFYPVKMNAEDRGAITWMGKSYVFNPEYKTHNFALFLTNGNLSYPTTVILPADGSEPQAIPGYLEPHDLELVVRYFAEGGYGKTPFEEYRKKFKYSW